MNTKLQSFASLIASLSKELKGQKTPQMQSTSVHGGTIQHYDNGGQPTLAMGLTGDGTHAVIYQTGPIPPGTHERGSCRRPVAGCCHLGWHVR